APASGRRMLETKIRNLRSGKQTERRFRSEESVDRISLDTRELEYLYNEGTDYHFMNLENYEQITLTADTLGDNVYYLIPNIKVQAQFHEENPISIEMPTTVDLLVTET